MKIGGAFLHAAALLGLIALPVPVWAGDEDRGLARDGVFDRGNGGRERDFDFDPDREGSLEQDKERKDRVSEGDLERARSLGLKEDAFEPDRRPFAREEE